MPDLSLAQVLPAPVGDFDINCCPDPSCGNFGVSSDLDVQRFLGRGAPERRAAAARLSNSTAMGLATYNLHNGGSADLQRVSQAFEYAGDPHAWTDGRGMECQFQRMSGPCGSRFAILSNEHLLEEVERLRNFNGALDGPRCKACGQLYLDAPNEFLINGANGNGIRLVHRPCRKKKGGRFTVSLDHERQRRSSDNVQILQALVNGAGINDLVRMLGPSGSGRACGVSRVYDRIFWFERVMLAFEREQLRRWREKVAASGVTPRHHLAHDDVVLSINWETREDRRITQLNCSVTADVRSGFVYRIDVDFDPTVDAVSAFNAAYVDSSGRPTRLRQAYTSKSTGPFTHPLMGFQRPTGRLDEPQFFAAAAGQLRVFRDTKAARMPSGSQHEAVARSVTLTQLNAQIEAIQTVHEGYFDLPDFRRDRRAPFTGVPTRDTYTKGAHFLLLREMLPPGWVTLVTEQEATLARLLPHIFHDEIQSDNLVWLAMTFDKEAKKPTLIQRVEDYKKDFDAFITAGTAAGIITPVMGLAARRRAYIADRMRTQTGFDRTTGKPAPFPSSNYQQPYMPSIWVRSPIQSGGETEKIVGFPLIRSSLREAIRPIEFDEEITDDAIRKRLAWLVWSATLQPVSTFFNSLRERVSFAGRAGGRAARSGPSYINGASYNPRVLIALLNIFRVHYNWFEARQYVAPWSMDAGTEEAKPGLVSVRVPGTDRTIQVEKRRNKRPVYRTPAMRHGIQKERKDKSGRLVMPSLHRVLYRPWLYAGTPLWDKLENQELDLRRRSAQVRGQASGNRKPPT